MVIALQAGGHQIETGRGLSLHFGGFAEATSLLRQTLNTETHYRHGAEAARRAHNPEVTGSKPVAGILHFGGFTEATSLLRQTLNTVSHYRRGAEEARRAHNSEDVGSKPTAGIFYIFIALHGTDVWLNDAKESGYGPGLNPFFIQLDSGKFMNLHSVGFCKPY